MRLRRLLVCLAAAGACSAAAGPSAHACADVGDAFPDPAERADVALVGVVLSETDLQPSFSPLARLLVTRYEKSEEGKARPRVVRVRNATQPLPGGQNVVASEATIFGEGEAYRSYGGYQDGLKGQPFGLDSSSCPPGNPVKQTFSALKPGVKSVAGTLRSARHRKSASPVKVVLERGPFGLACVRYTGTGIRRDRRSCIRETSSRPVQVIVQQFKVQTVVIAVGRELERIRVTGARAPLSATASPSGRLAIVSLPGAVSPAEIKVTSTLEDDTTVVTDGMARRTLVPDPLNRIVNWTAGTSPRDDGLCAFFERQKASQFVPNAPSGLACGRIAQSHVFFKVRPSAAVPTADSRTVIFGAADATIGQVLVRSRGVETPLALARRGGAFLSVFGADVAPREITVVVRPKAGGELLFGATKDLNLATPAEEGPRGF